MAIESRLRRLEAGILGQGEERPDAIDVKELLKLSHQCRAWLTKRGHADLSAAVAAGERPPVADYFVQLMLKAESDLASARRLGELDYVP